MFVVSIFASLLDTYPGGAGRLYLLPEPRHCQVGADSLSHHLTVLPDPSLEPLGLTFRHPTSTSLIELTSSPGSDSRYLSLL